MTKREVSLTPLSYERVDMATKIKFTKRGPIFMSPLNFIIIAEGVTAKNQRSNRTIWLVFSQS